MPAPQVLGAVVIFQQTGAVVSRCRSVNVKHLQPQHWSEMKRSLQLHQEDEDQRGQEVDHMLFLSLFRPFSHTSLTSWRCTVKRWAARTTRHPCPTWAALSSKCVKVWCALNPLWVCLKVSVLLPLLVAAQQHRKLEKLLLPAVSYLHKYFHDLFHCSRTRFIG